MCVNSSLFLCINTSCYLNILVIIATQVAIFNELLTVLV